jgi:hypothetical protein
LAENAPYNPKEALFDFFDEKRNELDSHLEWGVAERDRQELFWRELGKISENAAPTLSI